jgi:hypothetical protein
MCRIRCSKDEGEKMDTVKRLFKLLPILALLLLAVSCQPNSTTTTTSPSTAPTTKPTATGTTEPTATVEPTPTATVEPTATAAPMVVPTIEGSANLQEWSVTNQVLDEANFVTLPADGVALQPGYTLILSWHADNIVSVYYFTEEQYRLFKLNRAAGQTTQFTATGKFGFIKIAIQSSDKYYTVLINDSGKKTATLSSAELTTG